MRRQINNVSYNLNEMNNFVEINLYEASPGVTPVKKEDLVLITNTMLTSMMIIEVKTKNLIYEKDFNNLTLKLYEDVSTNNIQFRMYKINSLAYPSVLPSGFKVVSQTTEDVTGYKCRLFDIGGYLTSSNSTYYFFVQPYAKSGSSTCNVKLNINYNINKLALINVEYSSDIQLPQYLKFDNNLFNNCNIDINLYNGNIIVNKPLITFKGNRLPMNLCYVYNDYIYDYAYVNLTSNIYYDYNNKFKLNYFQMIKKHSKQDKYLFINDIGEKLYFSKVKEGYYINDNGRGLYLIKQTNKYIIEDYNGNQLEFNSDGYLTYIRDNIESELGSYIKGIKITYTKKNNIYYLTSIKDSIDREVLIDYTTSYIKLTYLNNKEIYMNINDNGVMSINNEYGDILTFTYDTSCRLTSINESINSLLIQYDEIFKLCYAINNTIENTKEYIYEDTNEKKMTTITTYRKQKNNLNQIIHKFCFNENGDFTNDYEDINGVIYNENKRIENVFNIETNLSLTKKDQTLIDKNNVFECILPENKSIKTFSKTININKNDKLSDYQLLLNFVFDKISILNIDNVSHEILIKVSQKINSEITTINETNLFIVDNEIYGNSTHSLKLVKEFDWGDDYSGNMYELLIDLDWNQLISNNIELIFDVELKYIANLYITNVVVIGKELNITLPTALFGDASENDMIFENVYRFNVGFETNHDSNKLYKTNMYGLCNPHKIYYKDSNRNSHIVDNTNITLQELITNSINMGKRKNIFWYNNFKNIIIEDDLYYYESPLPKIYFENNDSIRISNLNFTIPFEEKNGLKSYYIYYNDNLLSYLGIEEMDVIEMNVKETSDGRALFNIKHKDKYNRVISEEITDKIIEPSGNFNTEDYINIKKQYCYDENNNLISEETVTEEIYINSHSMPISVSNVTYQYDESNNLIQINENGKITFFQYDENNNLIKTISPMQNSINYSYDNKERCNNISMSNENKMMNNLIEYNNNNLLDKLKYNNHKSGYKYLYNAFNMLESVCKINDTGNYNMVVKTYELVDEIDENNLLGLQQGQYGIVITLTNGTKIAYVYDKYDKLLFEKELINNVYVLRKEYIYMDANVSSTSKKYQCLLEKEVDYITKMVSKYFYDENNNICKIKRYIMDENNENYLVDEFYINYEQNKLVNFNIGNSTNYLEHKRADMLSNEKVSYSDNNYFQIEYKYNDISELVNKSIYFNRNNKTKNMNLYYDNGIVSTYTLPFKEHLYMLTYDSENKITSLKNQTLNVNELELTYDSFGQLIEETNRTINKKYKYNYDVSGNISSKEIYNLNNELIENMEFVYDGPNYDTLTKIVKNSTEQQNVQYTNLNPISIGTDILEWSSQNLLTKYTRGDNTYNYYYNADGIRYKKALNKTNNEIIEYNIYGTKILSETHKKEVNSQMELMYSLKYIYTSEGLYGFIYEQNGEETLYIYEKDILNNIISLVKVTDTIEIVAHYKYNAWGEHLVCDADGNLNNSETFIGNINPFRYRGYYYDVETGLFWLSSRYYSPELCRFISPDDVSYLDPESVNGLNLYCYCANDPVMCR